MNAKRGYVPEDERNFSPEAIETRNVEKHLSVVLCVTPHATKRSRYTEHFPFPSCLCIMILSLSGRR